MRRLFILGVVVNWFIEEEKYEENSAIFRNTHFKNYLANFKFGMPSCMCSYKESI